MQHNQLYEDKKRQGLEVCSYIDCDLSCLKPGPVLFPVFKKTKDILQEQVRSVQV